MMVCLDGRDKMNEWRTPDSSLCVLSLFSSPQVHKLIVNATHQLDNTPNGDYQTEQRQFWAAECHFWTFIFVFFFAFDMNGTKDVCTCNHKILVLCVCYVKSMNESCDRIFFFDFPPLFARDCECCVKLVASSVCTNDVIMCQLEFFFLLENVFCLFLFKLEELFGCLGRIDEPWIWMWWNSDQLLSNIWWRTDWNWNKNTKTRSVLVLNKHKSI